MWNATPWGTNSHWQAVTQSLDTGGSSGGGGGFVATNHWTGSYSSMNPGGTYNPIGCSGSLVGSYVNFSGGFHHAGGNVSYANGGFYYNWWTGGGSIPGGMDLGTWHRKFVSTADKFVNWTVGVSNNIDSFSDRLIKTTVGEAIAFTEKNFNGGLGYTDVAVKGYNRIPNDFKHKMAYELSKITNMKSGKIYQNSKAFMSKAGKVAGKLGKLSTTLSVVAGAADLLDDGNVKTSTAVNLGLLTVGLAFPVTAPFVLAYGVLDYTFDIGDKLDAQFGGINTHIYD